MSCRNRRLRLQFPYGTLVRSRSLPKHTSQYATMVAWIEKEVEASIMEIDPCFIGSLQRVCFKFLSEESQDRILFDSLRQFFYDLQAEPRTKRE